MQQEILEDGLPNTAPCLNQLATILDTLDELDELVACRREVAEMNNG